MMKIPIIISTLFFFSSFAQLVCPHNCNYTNSNIKSLVDFFDDTTTIRNYFNIDSIVSIGQFHIKHIDKIEQNRCKSNFQGVKIKYSSKSSLDTVWKELLKSKLLIFPERFKTLYIYMFKDNNTLYFIFVDYFIDRKYCNKFSRLMYNHFLNTYKDLYISTNSLGGYLRVMIKNKKLVIDTNTIDLDLKGLNKITIIK